MTPVKVRTNGGQGRNDDLLVAALWGFAEATLFFIVPDVLLTVVALLEKRAGLFACGAATSSSACRSFSWSAFPPREARFVILTLAASRASRRPLAAWTLGGATAIIGAAKVRSG